MTKRERQRHVTLSEDEDRMLRELCAVTGLTASDYLRQSIRRDYAERAARSGTRVPQ